MHSVETIPNHDLVLRRITAGDWPLWRAVRLSALAEAPYAFGSTLASWTGAGDQEKRWRQRLTTVPLNIVAFLKDSAVGMVSGTGLDESGAIELISMWVAPSARGSGVADALVKAILDSAREQSAARVTADVTDGNERAGRLYSRHGFVADCAVTCGDSEPRPARRMVLELLNQEACHPYSNQTVPRHS
jgi:RimJ/RimL family protein N-acetyltransferase